MAGYYVVEPPALEAFGTRVFVALGTPEDIAAEVAGHLVRANLAGHDSHGAMRILQYASMIADGWLRPAARPSVVRRRGATVLVDAAEGFGQFSTSFALEQAIALAAEQGAGVAAVRRSHHIGRLGDYTERAARRGYVAQVTVGAAGPGVGGAAPFGGAARFLGTNPWSLAVPTPGEPVVADFATTVVAEGKVRVARAKGEALPPGCIVDSSGHPSTDPAAFYAGGMLLPAGGHKGYALSLGAALIGGLAAIGESEPSVAGAAARPRSEGNGERLGGVLLLVIDPGAFGDPAEYLAATGRVTAALKRVPPAPGTAEVLLPGEPEVRSRAQREREGISLPQETWDALTRLAATHDLPVPPATPQG
ncbi:MAG TPA: Ldh family oxidoreductase [Chloroflexota bacterium]|nr:Ldh family oxidoreductase [Chloroflexota bacterium]